MVTALNRPATTLDVPTLTDLGYEDAGDGFLSTALAVEIARAALRRPVDTEPARWVAPLFRLQSGHVGDGVPLTLSGAPCRLRRARDVTPAARAPALILHLIPRLVPDQATFALFATSRRCLSPA